MKKLIPLVLMLMTAVSCVFSGPSYTPKVVTAPEPAQPNGYSSDEQSSTQVNTFPTKIPVVNVYLETSGSMNGYVNNGQSQFQQVVYDYLSNIKNSGLVSELNLNYITNCVTPKGNDVNSFVNNLNSTGLLQASGSKATTDIAALIETILDSTEQNQVSILITDCIFSPGNVQNPQNYLENQKISIRNAVKSYIDKNHSVGCSIYRFMSDFRGKYFDFKNRPSRIDMKRPFYIIVFGNAGQLASIKSKVPDANFMGSPVESTWTIVNGDFSDVDGLNDYGLLQSGPVNGDYRWKSPKSLKSVKISSDGYFKFTFGIDMKLPVLLYGEEYATNPDNYCNLINKQTSESYFLSIRQNNIKSSKFTHNATLMSEKPFPKGEISVVFDGRIPQWVYDCTDLDDTVLKDANSGKTYGFSYMCEGIYAGFHANNSNNITAKYHFEIN